MRRESALRVPLSVSDSPPGLVRLASVPLPRMVVPSRVSVMKSTWRLELMSATQLSDPLGPELPRHPARHSASAHAAVPAGKVTGSGPELRLEERHRLRPGCLRRLEVRAVRLLLSAQESVAGALVDLVLVRLAEALHRGIRRRNRRGDARVRAAVQ